MKWILPLAALALAQARGLKTAKIVDGDESLKVENQRLKEESRRLEAMMQVARGEVQRMDKTIKDDKARNLRLSHGENEEAEIASLTKKLEKAKADRKSLSDTLRQMLAKNSTKIYKAEAAKAVEDQHAAEKQYNKQLEAMEVHVKEVQEKTEEAKELARSFQDQNMDLQKTLRDTKAKLAVAEQKDQDLTQDRAILMNTMHGLMRDQTKAKQDLQNEIAKEQAEAKELASVKAKLEALEAATAAAKKKTKAAKPAEKPKPESKWDKFRKSVTDVAPLHLNHEESGAYKIAKLKDINRYIDSTATVANDAEETPAPVSTPTAAPKQNDWASMSKQVDSLAKAEDAEARQRIKEAHVRAVPKDVAAPTAVHKDGLGDYLGLKMKVAPVVAQSIPAPAEAKPSAAKQAKDEEDDGGDGVEDILSQAKQQLNDMDDAEAKS